MRLTPIMRQYILHWGEMGTRWKVNRPMVQIHPLLYLSPQFLDAETTTEPLSVARPKPACALAQTALRSGRFNRAKRYLFGARRRAQLLYPPLLNGRHMLLRILGWKPISG